MSSRPKTDRAPAATAVICCLLGALLSGCSDPGFYLDRRDSIALSAGDAVAANAAMQTIDPWPLQSANTRFAATGQRMQSAVERYRNDAVTPPVDPMMLQVANPTPATSTNSNGTPSSSTPAPSAPAGTNSLPTSTAGNASNQ